MKLEMERIKQVNKEQFADYSVYIDFSCRFNTFFNELKEVLDETKNEIKTQLVKSGKTIAEGHTFLAVLSETDVTRLDTDRVKQFLGKRLKEYQYTSKEFSLRFKPKI